MLLHIGNKKIAILVIILIILLIFGGVFLWRNRKGEEKIPPPTSDYEIIETLEGKIVENKKEKFTVKVPDGWTAKDYVASVGLFSPETEFDENGGFLDSVREKGACGIGIDIKEYRNSQVESLEDLIRAVQKNPTEMEKDGYSVIIVNSRPALKQTIKKEGEIKFIEVDLPVRDKIYYFESGLIINQQCVKEFEKILETVSIDI